jgi:hypothetical protein
MDALVQAIVGGDQSTTAGGSEPGGGWLRDRRAPACDLVGSRKFRSEIHSDIS